MPFCPRCRCEYNVGVAECIDCHLPVVLQRPRRRAMFDVDLDDLLVPGAALLSLLGSLGLFGISQLARAGQIAEPLGPMIASQPVCLTVFYAIAAVLSGLILVVALLRALVFR